MEFPDDIIGKINKSKHRRLDDSLDSILLEVLMINGDQQEIDKNLRSWTVT